MPSRIEMIDTIAQDRVANLTDDTMRDYIDAMNYGLAPIDQTDWLNDEAGLKQRIYQLEVEECQTYDDALLSEEYRLTIRDQQAA